MLKSPVIIASLLQVSRVFRSGHISRVNSLYFSITSFGGLYKLTKLIMLIALFK